MFRRHKQATVTDIEAARRAANSVGGYDETIERDSLATVTPLPTSAAPADHTVAAADSPAPKTPLRRGASYFPAAHCGCGGHIAWIDRGNHYDGWCCTCGKRVSEFKDDELRRRTVDATWARRYRQAGLEVPRSVADAAVRIDELKNENAVLRSQIATLTAQRDNATAQANSGRMTP